MLLKIWSFLSYLGVKDDQPVYIKKSIILFNQIVRICLFFLLIAILSMHFLWNLKSIANVLLIVALILAFTLFLNLKGKIVTAGLILANVIPVAFIGGSIYLKINNESISLYLYLIPRIALIIFSLIPIALLAFLSPKKAIFGSITGVLIFAFFDKIHDFFGVGISGMPLKHHHYTIFILVLSGLFMFTVLLIVFLQNINLTYEKMVLQQKKEIEMQKSEIEAQRDEIEAQRDEIQKQHDFVIEQRDEISFQKKQITDSIVYAQRIQVTVLPQTTILNDFFSEFFILYKPKDIVSGDFYWFTPVQNQKMIIAVADCTGHGVPGAFMSMLGLSFINEIVNLRNITIPNLILEELRVSVKKFLHQTGKIGESKEGMDISLCLFDKITLNLQFAGANNPVYIIRKAFENENELNIESFKISPNKYELIELKPDHMPIGIYKDVDDSFSIKEIQLVKNDVVYLFSDGYEDQFGGTSGRKFLSKNLKNLLLSLNVHTLEKQKEIMNSTLTEWMGTNYKQIDDICFLGVKI